MRFLVLPVLLLSACATTRGDSSYVFGVWDSINTSEDYYEILPGVPERRMMLHRNWEVGISHTKPNEGTVTHKAGFFTLGDSDPEGCFPVQISLYNPPGESLKGTLCGEVFTLIEEGQEWVFHKIR